MKNDPKIMVSRFNSTCSKCKKAIKKGEDIIFWPYNRTADHFKCGETDYRQFEASAQDESFYNSQY